MKPDISRMVRPSTKLLPFEFREQPSATVDEVDDFGEAELRAEDEVGRLADGQATGETAPLRVSRAAEPRRR